MVISVLFSIALTDLDVSYATALKYFEYFAPEDWNGDREWPTVKCARKLPDIFSHGDGGKLPKTDGQYLATTNDAGNGFRKPLSAGWIWPARSELTCWRVLVALASKPPRLGFAPKRHSNY